VVVYVLIKLVGVLTKIFDVVFKEIEYVVGNKGGFKTNEFDTELPLESVT